MQNIPLDNKKNRLDIIRDILIYIKKMNGRIETDNPLPESDTNHRILSEYLIELKEKQLISDVEDEQGRICSPTQKGYDYINKYDMIKEFISGFGLE